MGKYLKKSKPTTDVSPTSSSSLLTMGVRTRAKTLALQRVRQESVSEPQSDPELSYLQLRSRRLQKTNVWVSKGRQRKSEGQGSRQEETEEEEKGGFRGSDLNLSVDGSFGENDLEFDARDRSTRESTPCSFIGGSDTIPIPGSTTRRRRSSISSQRIPNDLLRGIPTTQEIEDFFATAEEQQRKSFIEKYNFDILNDIPLPGRYEWVEVMP